MDYWVVQKLKWIGVFLVSLLLLGPSKPASAQGQKGAVSGLVTDQAGAVLKGAEVSIETNDVHVVTSEAGNFVITGLDPGTYDVIVNYVGFATFTQSVSVSAGQTASLDAKLQLKSQSESILVTAPRVEGEAEAVNIERSADNLVQVMPEEVIRSLPNANLADALGRLPSVTLERDEGEGKYVQVRGLEPRLTNATIDGVDVPAPEPGVRQVKFDSIPADLVESVQISKTLLPNMEGDGIGGSVNLVTKTATEQPTISINGLGGYTPIIHGRGLTEDGGTIGERFGPGKKFGVIIGGSYDWNGRGIDDIEPVPDIATLLPGGQQVSWKDGMDIREYQYFRSRWGLAGSANYKLSEASNIYVRGFYSDFHNYGDRYRYSLTDNTPAISVLAPGNEGCSNSGAVLLGTCESFVPPSYAAELRNPDIGVSNLMVGGVHDLTTTWFAWDVAVSRGWYSNSPYSDANFGPIPSFTTSDCQYDPANTANQYLPRWSEGCYQEISDPTNFEFQDISRQLGPSAQLNIEASGSGAKRYHIGSKLATFEVGGRFRNEHKYNEYYQLTLSPISNLPSGQFPLGYIPMSMFQNRLVNHNYYLGGQYNLGYNPSYEDAIAFYNANPNLFTSSSTQGQDGHDFDLVEKVSAGYFMNTIDLSTRWRLIAGLRIEGTTDNFSNFIVNEVSNTLSPNKASGSYITYLPSAALKYAVTANDNLRFIYARGLSRPDPEQFAQAIDISTNANGTFKYSATFDNPNLRAETGDDFDVLYDHYFSAFGVISAGYFYKYLHDPIVDQQSVCTGAGCTLPGGLTGNFQETTPVNAGHGWVTGVELAYLQHFSSLPGVWGGLGLSANYGYTKSRAIGIPGRSDSPALPRTSPNAFNISPTYDRGPLSLRLGVSYNQASIYAYQFTDGLPGGVNGPLSDIYFYSHVQLDAQGSLRLGHGVTLLASGLDLNNEVFGFYQGSPQYMIQREYYQPTVSLGVRWEPLREK